MMMIRIEALSKSFNERKVINNLDLEVQKNEVRALLGPNGSGKTTLLNMIAGLLRPDGGNIYIDNVMVSGLDGAKKVNFKPFERKVGYVFQSISLFPHMKIQDNVSYGLKSLHLSEFEVKKRTVNMLDFVGLAEYAQAYPSQLSGGQQQRVALARTLATEPQVILLDEPVSAVDSQLKESFRLELKKYLQALEITTLYVTHNLNEAFMMADKIAVLGNGHIEQVGDRVEIFDKPKSTFVAKFLGINVFEGRAIKEQNGLLQVEVNDVSLLSASNSELSGKKVTLTIKPEDLRLSIEKPTNTEGFVNNILGVLTEMTQMRSTVQVTIDMGFSIKARVTYDTVKSLGVTIGDRVYVSFSPSVLNVFSATC
ncbi:MAG: ABC transporter ATP-binding protein [Nitrososphaerota archaeon]|jgi:ABC-type Fe3+/spermidine/putrescine transport system ATPase subunit|nr:ABC transporter ATP-binding protein [Nitrososphaerota archaeon]